MKKNILIVLSLLVAIFGVDTKSNGQTLLHYWSFNVDPSVALTPTYSMISGAALTYAGATNDTVQLGTTLNAVGADMTLNASSAALRLRNPADPFTMALPTTGHKNIVLAYAEQRTKKGAQQNTVTYSTDGGASWINTAIAATATYWVDSTDTVSNTPYQLETFNFSSDLSVNNNPNFQVRINFSIGDTGTAGNDRFDNITLRGDTATASAGVSSATSLSAAYELQPNPATDNISVNSLLEGDKSVVVTNAIGQNVYTGTASGQHFVINVAKFATGNYYMNIRENSNGYTTTLKFVKK